MTLHRSQEDRETLRAASAIKRRESKERRIANKKAAADHIRALVASKAPGKRAPRQKDNVYLSWIRRLPCAACAFTGGACGPVQAAHLRYSDAALGRINSGMQQKPDDKWVTPLGAGHHAEQHAGNERAFWERIGIEPGALCMALHAAFLAGQDGEPVVRRFAAATLTDGGVE